MIVEKVVDWNGMVDIGCKELMIHLLVVVEHHMSMNAVKTEVVHKMALLVEGFQSNNFLLRKHQQLAW